MNKMTAAALAAVLAVSAPAAGALSEPLSVTASAAATESALTSGDFIIPCLRTERWRSQNIRAAAARLKFQMR